MHDYLLSSEWVRFAFVLGVAVSMVLYEKRHLTTGSIVVPGYIAIFLIQPLVIIATFVNALITYAIVNTVLRRYFLLYGRTKFTVLAIVSTVIQTTMLRLTPSGEWLWESDVPLFIGVGYIVPALIAHDMARQGIMKTTKSVMLAGSLVAIPIALALLFQLPGVNDLAPVTGYGHLAIKVTWLPVTVALSILASWAVAMNYGFRSGGFVGAAFIGMFMADPWQVLVAVVIAAITYVIVAKFLMKHMILFGRRKFSSMLLVSSSIAWSGLWIGDRFLNAAWEQHVGVGSLALTPLLLPGLLANDAQRTSPARVLGGVAMAGSFAVSTTFWIRSVVVGTSIHPGWKVVSAVVFVVLFHKQLTPLARHLHEKIANGAAAGYANGGFTPSIPPPIVNMSAVWADERKSLAENAEAWLDAQLAKFTGPTFAVASSTGSADPRIHALDHAAMGTLEGGLDFGRWMRLTPRQLIDEVRSDTTRPQISETSDVREAQLPPSDVSDNTGDQHLGHRHLTERELDEFLGLVPQSPSDPQGSYR
jgi:poly-gamma-glutamate biosynthesis protein PgsC/CapC